MGEEGAFYLFIPIGDLFLGVLQKKSGAWAGAAAGAGTEGRKEISAPQREIISFTLNQKGCRFHKRLPQLGGYHHFQWQQSTPWLSWQIH